MPDATHHPSIDALLQLSQSTAEQRSQLRDLVAHVDGCDECRARVSDLASWDESIAASRNEGLPETAKVMAGASYRDGLAAARVVPLIKMEFPREEHIAHLAADSGAESIQRNAVFTFYSEQPEVVVRVMREAGTGNLTIAVITDDPETARFAMVSIGDERFLCDESGSCQAAGGVKCDPEHDPVRLVLRPTTP